jgi:Uma2 family endonuclease
MSIVKAVPAIEGPDLEELENFPLIESDGEPLESHWHVDAIPLMIHSILFHNRGREDYYAGGNMFIYYNLEQARTLSYRGPDFFFVKNTHLHPRRRYWVVWKEGDKYPDAIIELLSPTTAKEDRTTKKDIYEQIFKTAEYFLYDPDTHQLEGWRIGAKERYEKIEPNDRGWLWSHELGLWVGSWYGKYGPEEATWLRFYDSNQQLVLIDGEYGTQCAEAERQRADAERQRADDERQRAEAERQRAEAERQRAEAAEAELARLKAQLAQAPSSPPSQE